MHPLKQALLDRNMSQNKLSQLAMVPSCSLSMIVNNKLLPCPVWRKRISEVLEISESTLFPNQKLGGI